MPNFILQIFTIITNSSYEIVYLFIHISPTFFFSGGAKTINNNTGRRNDG